MGASSVTVCQTQISLCQIQMFRFRHFYFTFFTKIYTFILLCRFIIFATECCLSWKPQKVMTTCICQVCECFENFVFWLQFKFLLVPKHCQVTSKLFTIKPVHTIHPHNYEEITSLNIIYKIEEDHLLLESVDINNKGKQEQRMLTKLHVPSKIILNQINKTRHQLSQVNTRSTFRLSGETHLRHTWKWQDWIYTFRPLWAAFHNRNNSRRPVSHNNWNFWNFYLPQAVIKIGSVLFIIIK